MYMSASLSLSAAVLLTFGALAVPAEAGDDKRESAKSSCKVDCVDPLASCSESQRVIETCKTLVAAYAEGDLRAYEEYLDDNCTTFNEVTKELVCGKARVLAHLKQSFEDNAPGGRHPLVSCTIDQPYARVNGDTCVVTFTAVGEFAGDRPRKVQGHVTEIFVKRGDKWKRLHFRGHWENEAE